MTYIVHDKATDATTALDGISIDLTNYQDVILLDDKPIELAPIVDKIKTITTEVKTQLESTENIEE